MKPALLTHEAIIGGGYQYLGALARALPTYIDDISEDFGDEIYSRMLVDSQVAACMAVFRASILEDGVSLSPAVDDATEDGYDLAKQITDECERMLDDLEQSLDDVLWDMLDSLALGNRLAEQTYENRARITDGKPGLMLSQLKVKPRHSYYFVVDQFTNTVGVLGRTAGQTYVNLGTLLVDPANPPENFFSTEKFVISTFRPKNSDPRGTSVLRPAYDPWWRKRAALKDYVAYLAQFASPSIWATTAPDAQQAPQLDFLGNVTDYSPPLAYDPLGNPQPVPTATLTPEQDLLGKLQQFRNGSVGAFTAGTVLNTIQMTGEGRAFLNAIAEANMSITKAILTQTLTTEEGEHQARAAAQVHQDVLDTLVRQGKRSVVRMLHRQVLRRWVAYNWGDAAAAKLTPKASLGTTEEQDRTPMMNAIAALTTSGFLDASQFPAIDDELGLPVRDLSIVDEPDEASDDGEPPPAAGQSGDSEAGAAPGDAQPQQQEQPPADPNKVNVRPHQRNRPQPRKGAYV